MAFDIISLMRKRDYLEWFLANYTLKEEGLRPILEYMKDSRVILEKIRFVENIRPYDSGLLISSKDSQTVSYLLRIDGLYYEDIEEFFHALKNEQYTKLFVWLSFDRSFLCNLCEKQNPENEVSTQLDVKGTTEKGKRVVKGIVKPDIKGLGTAKVSFQDTAREVFHDLEKEIKAKELRRMALLERIDDALDNRDERLFKALVLELKKII